MTDEEDDMTYHQCCWYRAGRLQNCRMVQAGGWWAGGRGMTDKTPALLPLPFLLKSLTRCIWHIFQDCISTASWHTQNPFLFWSPLKSSLLRQHSSVIRAAVALLSQPSGPPAALDQSERATVANLSLIGWRWLKGFSCVSDESPRRKAR